MEIFLSEGIIVRVIMYICICKYVSIYSYVFVSEIGMIALFIFFMVSMIMYHYTNVNICMHADKYIHVCIRTTYIYIYVLRYIFIDTYTYVHICIFIYVFIYI
jgi:hypothetical protein